MRTFERILVAIDREDRAGAPLRFAVELAQKTGAELVVFHSISEDEQKDRELLPPPSNYVDVMVEETVRDLTELTEAAATAAGSGLPSVRAVTRWGDPAEEIGRVAADEDCGLIVIGLRRRSRVGKFLLGSNLQDVLMATDRPVISVPIDDEGPEPTG
ncbi:MAG: universal stress protein [Acidimicrobiia bacterium]